MYDCDVLIVGAGPVGTTLALELAHKKTSFRIIDQTPERSNKSRALVVQPRTLELLNRHGHAEKLFLWGGKPIATMAIDNIGTSDTEFTLPLSLSQAETERFLDDCLASYGHHVDRPVTAIHIAQDSSGVTTTLQRPNETQETIFSKYVVGCDGAHSAVRRAAANITFDGAAYPQNFLLCDAHLQNSNIARDCVSLCLGDGILAFIPMKDDTLVRVIASGHRFASDEEPTLEQFQELIAIFTPPGFGALSDPAWLTRFRLHHRSVSSYRDGRLFVAGDAAHIHSPAGGQGMNTGIQDAINLGWKLAAVLDGRAANPEALLDSYDAERLPVGVNLLKGSDRMFSFLSSTNYWFVTLRNLIIPWVLPWVAASLFVRLRFFRFLSEFGISYRKGPIVGTAAGFKGPIRGGDRLPDGKLKEAKSGTETSVHGVSAGGDHCLLLFSGKTEGEPDSSNALRAAGDKVFALERTDLAVRFILRNKDLEGDIPDHSYVDHGDEVHPQFGFAKFGFVLVRPDGYIAHIGPLSSLDELLTFFKSLLL
ncbi:FAD binding domain-containing protein [Lasiosphaeris hirsuta]|uniref:FAD binding domain-containing protein n=1 Tax=Lasiosphaeris hirsuta TaxID=260670 RepID=A0AA40AQW0_9PEZI|nr:FAD binding domain-containing protein [Lasiosphaeris hirsuta]